LHRVLGVDDELLRFRIAIGTCIVPCMVGFLVLLCEWIQNGDGENALKPHDEDHEDEETAKGSASFSIDSRT